MHYAQGNHALHNELQCFFILLEKPEKSALSPQGEKESLGAAHSAAPLEIHPSGQGAEKSR